ncbi:hypothetical protein SEA_SEJANUS_9 [Mycobacterium phage Sejanus]|nr:hypothetical protein SEA_SEJANUS_9 [Mycobacterium phage Sejanus]
MGCSCRGSRRAGTRAANGGTIAGFKYTAPDNTTTKTFLTLLEARAEQRRNGGGTIVQLTDNA